MKKSTWFIIAILAVSGGFVGSLLQNSLFGLKGSTTLKVASDREDLLKTVNTGGEDLTKFETASAVSTPTVVFIKTVSTVRYESPFGFWDFDPFGSRGKASSSGSGVIVSSDGYIVTNNHVIQGAEKISVVLNKGKREFEATVVGADPSTDLALIKIDKSELPAIVFGNSDKVNVGEWVLAVGNPFNLNSTVTAGIVSAKGRNINIVKNRFPIESFIQTDAAINPGNSGGALVNLNGELVGINTAIQSNTGSYTGYGFAIPSNIVKKIVQDFIEKGEVLRAFTGFEVGPVSADEIQGLNITTDPVKIRALLEDGPADKVGLKRGDIIIKINGEWVNGRSGYDELLAYQRPGDKLELEVVRDGKPTTKNITLIGKSTQRELMMRGVVHSKYLGADFQPLGASDLAKYRIKSGIRIMNIRRGGAISQMGLREGFIVEKFNGKRFDQAEDLIAAMEGNSGRLKIEGKSANGSSQSFSFFRY